MGNSFTAVALAPSSGAFSPPGSFTASPALPGDVRAFYAGLADLENLAGAQNVALYSQLDPSNTQPDYARIGQALRYADSEIDNFFRDGPYVLGPHLTILSGHSTISAWAAAIALGWLYRGRYLQSGGSPAAANPFGQMLAEVKRDMSLYKAGQKRLDAVRVQALPSGPVVVVTT